MAVLVTCSECGGAIPSDAPEAMCPSCMWRLVEPSSAEVQAGDDEPLANPLAVSTAVIVNSTVDFVRCAAADSFFDGALPASLAHSPSGRRLGNYDLIEELGRGGMGIVYKAVQRLAGRTVAVKLVLGGAASSAADRHRFLVEVQSLARLQHPHIVPVYEVNEEDGCPYFSMEYMPGGTLSDKVRQGPVPIAEAAEIIERLAAAVHAAHSAGVLHRDIKPGNVMLDSDGTPKLTDFGLAKQLNQGDGPTRTGSVVGTPAYMPPEQAAGVKELTAAADVYSLGATLYALLTSRAPFVGRDFGQTIHRVLHDDPVSPRSLRGQIPRDLEAVCLKALEKDLARRYPTAQALGEDLARWREGASTLARPQRWPRRIWRQARRHRRAIAIAAALLAVAALVTWALQPPDTLAPIDAALARGEKVVLIGETGPPKWHRWAAGTGDVTDRQHSGTFGVFAVGSAYLELAQRVPPQSYRISAEFRVDDATDPDSRAGLYFARVASGRTPAGHATRMISCALRDDLITHKQAHSDGDPLQVQDCLIVSTPNEPMNVWAVPMGVLYVKEAKPVPRPWRRISAEVRPDGIRVCFQRDVGSEPGQGLEEVGLPPIPTARIERQAAEHRKSLAEKAANLAATRLEYDPNAGCGLYVRNARVFFRNVSVEPVP